MITSPSVRPLFSLHLKKIIEVLYTWLHDLFFYLWLHTDYTAITCYDHIILLCVCVKVVWNLSYHSEWKNQFLTVSYSVREGFSYSSTWTHQSLPEWSHQQQLQTKWVSVTNSSSHEHQRTTAIILLNRASGFCGSFTLVLTADVLKCCLHIKYKNRNSLSYRRDALSQPPL